MNKQTLGNTDLHTAPIVFGGNVFGWTLNEQESFAMLDDVFEAGFNTIDTSNSYGKPRGSGRSETIIGQWMKDRGNRSEVNVITKVGSDIGQGHKDISADHILKAADDSLKRLQIDQIDLYLTHWDDDRTPVEETLGAYKKLIVSGKVKYIGASNLSPERLQASLDAADNSDLPRYRVFQPEYNLYDRQGYEEGVSTICMRENMGVITYFSLASGFLTGKYRSKNDLNKSVRGSKTESYLNDRGKRILEALDELSEKHGTSQAAISLAWLINKPNVTAPIASATKNHHLQAFVEAAQLDLNNEDMERLEAASGY
jgi:aryl-alcohol dehydrogenase-like predicted oxidoreductase